MPYTDANPRIHYEPHGESGPPILLIMGLGMRSAVWRPQVEGLKDRFRLVTFDHRGIGDSELPPGRTWTMGDMAGDALSVLDAMGWETAHVVGVSMGGMVAQHLVLGAQARVRSLTLIATHAGGGLGARPTGRGLRLMARANLGPRSGRIETLTHLLYPDHFRESFDVASLDARMKEQVGVPPPKRALLGQLSAILRHDTRARLAEIRVPTQVIQPGEDLLVPPPVCEHLAAAIPDVRRVPIPEAGHGVIFQSREKVNEAIAEHVAQHD